MEHDFEANFFTLLALLDPGSRIEIEGAWKKLSIKPDQLIYQQGSDADAIYIIASGVVEAMTHSPDGKQTRSVAFMSKGEFFGDLGILTNHPRLAAIRACEPTQIYKIEKLKFVQLLDKIPKLGAYFARNLAKRLHKTSSEAYQNIFSIDLAGNLQHFDLLTIFQAITSTGRSGELRLNNAANDLIGSFFFYQGRVVHARFTHLEGLEAVWQGFAESTTDGTFSFRVMEQPVLPFNDAHKIELDATDLLMQGVTRRDDYNAIPEDLRKMECRIARKTEALQWTDPEKAAVADRVWEMIAKRPQHLENMWRRMTISALTFLEVVIALVQTGQAELLALEKAPEPAPPAAEPEPEAPPAE
jgi:CRP-like cAMP-binding protein